MCYRGVSEAVEFGPSMPDQSEPQHGLSLATFSGYDATQGFAGLRRNFLVSSTGLKKLNTQRIGDKSSGVLTKVKTPEQNPWRHRGGDVGSYFELF